MMKHRSQITDNISDIQFEVDEQFSRHQRLKSSLYSKPELITPTSVKRLMKLIDVMEQEIVTLRTMTTHKPQDSLRELFSCLNPKHNG